MGGDWIFCNILLVCSSLIRVATGCFSRVFKSTLQKWGRRGQIFQKRATRADLAVRAKLNVQKKTEKIAENWKKRIFWTKKSPSKSVKFHHDGRFFPTPCRMFSFRDLLLTLIFFWWRANFRSSFFGVESFRRFLILLGFALLDFFCYVLLYLIFFATFSFTWFFLLRFPLLVFFC